MNKLLKLAAQKLVGLIQGMFCGAWLSLIPVLLIQHKHIDVYIQHLPWSMLAFFSISIFVGGLIGFFLPIMLNKKLFLTLGYLFFYTACAALCQKIGLTTFTDSVDNLLTLIPGLILLLLAGKNFLQFAITKQRLSQSSKPIFSFYLSWLLFMASIPLIFGVWLPLLALPGAWVIILWLD